MDNRIAVNQSLEIPVKLTPGLDLLSPLPLDGIKLIIEIDKLALSSFITNLINNHQPLQYRQK